MRLANSNHNKSIAICSSEFPPGPGGIGAHAYQLASFLDSQGFSINVQTSSREKFNSESFDLSVPFHVDRYQANRGFIYKVFRSFGFVFNLRENNVRWMILSGSNQLFLAILIRIFCRCKIMAIIHGHEILMAQRIQKRILLMVLKSVDVIVAVSEFSRNNLMTEGFKKKIVVIPNGVSYKGNATHKDLTHTLVDDKLTLITVGSITKRKGQHNVIKAIPSLLSLFKEVEYHLVGMESEREAIEALATELQVADFVRIHGVVNDEERTRLLLASNIFIMLSENQSDGDVEGFGIAILEANQLGIPAIGSKNTGTVQAISNGISGLLVNASNVREITDAILEIKNDYPKYVVGSMQWAKKHDWEIVGENYIQLLNS
jgi:phosphatidylinositol alpha-1,6-mannosyltransferase